MRNKKTGKSRRARSAAILAIFSVATFGANSRALAVESRDLYCKYVMSQAAAERDQLRVPSLVTGISQPTTGEPAQLYWGVRSSISDLHKSALVMKAAQSECQLYRVTAAAELQVRYAVPKLEQQALQQRLDLIALAATELEERISESERLVASQTATRPAMYPLLAARVRLAAAKANTALATSAYVPTLEDAPLKDLLAQKRQREAEHQSALNAVTSQSNWSFAWSAGARRQLNQFFGSSLQPYGEASISYNFASRRINQHLQRAAISHGEWKQLQEGGPEYEGSALHQQLAQSVELHRTQLESLLEERKEIEKNLQLLAGVDTNAAVGFRNQLLADQILLNVDIGDISYQLEQLRSYLRDNF